MDQQPMIPKIGKPSRGVPCEKLHSEIGWLREGCAPVGTLNELQEAIRYGWAKWLTPP
jgi:hypothetical protein